MGRQPGADAVMNVRNEDPVAAVRRITGGKGVQDVLECSGAPEAVNQAARMVARGGRICLAAVPHEPVSADLAHIVRNNVSVFGMRGEGGSARARPPAGKGRRESRNGGDKHASPAGFGKRLIKVCHDDGRVAGAQTHGGNTSGASPPPPPRFGG